MSTRLVRTCTMAATAVAAVTLSTAPAHAAAATGCPANYDLVSVAELSAIGYQVPAKVDDPNSGVRSFGQTGNGNGLVCALPLGNQTTPWGTQVYNFWDDTLRS